MVHVAAGAFTRGSAEKSDEQPRGGGWLDAFWIDAYEVTVKAYAECVKAEVCAVPKRRGGVEYNWDQRGPREDRLEHPINGVDWAQAKAYCAWEGKRLPTEAEWEKAARGTDGRKFPWGAQDATCAHAVMDDTTGGGCDEERTWAVGSKPKGVSPYGAHDMAGNVSEWTADRYSPDAYVRQGDAARNPTGPASGELRVVRGGNFRDHSGFLRTTDRGPSPPSAFDYGLGFRCARSD